MLPPNQNSNPYIENATRWKELADIDYFSYFIKAWIPFNAWFRHAYSSTKERDILQAIKLRDNPIRNRLIRLLGQQGEDANEFKSYISQLHNRLEGYQLANQGKVITFRHCYIDENPQKQINELSDRMTYKITRISNNNITLEIIGQNGQTRFNYHQTTNYNWDEIANFPGYIALSPQQRTRLQGYYQQVNPKIEINLLDTNPPDSITIGSYQFRNSPENIFAGLIEVIYQLRCVLFHGEVVPNRNTNKIYEPAYHIVKIFLDNIS